MIIWAVLNVTHLDVVRVFNTKEAADEYATYENMKSDEDHFIHRGFEVDERMDDIYDFTDKDLSVLGSATLPMHLVGDTYAKWHNMLSDIYRKTINTMEGRNRLVYCVMKTVNYCSAIDFYRSEYIANTEVDRFKLRHPDTECRIFDEEHPEATIQFRGYFVEE